MGIGMGIGVGMNCGRVGDYGIPLSMCRIPGCREEEVGAGYNPVG